jgi:PLAT/LH2 domain
MRIRAALVAFAIAPLMLLGLVGTASASPAPAGAARTAAVAQYLITVHTGTPDGAGTDGDVWAWLRGTNGDSGWLYLDNSDDNFENNKTDYFSFTLNDVGPLTNLYIYFRPLGNRPDWYLDTVTITGPGYVRVFPANRWLTTAGYITLS